MKRKSAILETTSESAERLSDLLTLSYEPMLAWRLDGAIEFWNTGAERLYGFASDEALGRSSHSLLQTKFPIEFAELRSRLRTERYWSGELRHICKDGQEVIVDSRMQLLGTTPCLRSIATLRTPERSSLGKQRSAKFEAIFNQSGIFAGILDLEGYMREVNNLAVDWCGYTREQVLDRPFWETPWWRGSDEEKARIRFATHLAASGAVFREELRYWVADGTERIVDFAMHPIRDQSGAVQFLHKAAFTFVSERGAPFTVAGLGKLIERVGIASAAIELNRGQLARTKLFPPSADPTTYLQCSSSR